MPWRVREVHGKIRYVITVQQYPPGIRTGQTDEDVERCRLARAIRAQQADHLTLTDFQFHVIDDLPSSMGLADVDGL